MYSYTLYNDACILCTDTNKIIFEGEAGWDDFELWKEKNPKLHETIIKEKETKLKWNQGYPHIRDYDKYFYNENGELYKIDRGNSIEHFSNGKLYKRDERGKETTKFTENGTIFEHIDYEKNTLKKYDIKDGALLYFSKNKNNLKYIVEYYPSGTEKGESIFKSTLYKNKFLLKEQTNFPSLNIKTLLKFKKEFYYYKEFYITGILRSEGKLTTDKKMTGEWKFYHQNGKLESVHFFNNSVFSNKSKLYYENGKMIKEVNHD